MLVHMSSLNPRLQKRGGVAGEGCAHACIALHPPALPLQPKKKVEKKWDKGEPADEPLDDPVAEKLRRQR